MTFIGKAVPFYKEDPNGLLYLLLSMCVAWVCSDTLPFSVERSLWGQSSFLEQKPTQASPRRFTPAFILEFLILQLLMERI